MKTLSSILSLTKNQVIALVFIIVGCSVVITAVFLILYIFVFSKNHYKKMLKDLDRKFQYLDSLLQGQDSQYIHRLQIISNSNLLYVDTYNIYSKKYHDILETDDACARSILKQINSLIENKQFKNIKSVFQDAKQAILNFENSVNSLDSELKKVIKPEEDSRQKILMLKEKYRNVKQKYLATQNDLEIVNQSFSTVFNKLDSMFTDFDLLIDSAKYNEANDLLPKINMVISACSKALEEIPNLCLLVQKIIPSKMEELDRQYRNLEANGYPLYHLSYSHYVDKWNDNLRVLKDKLIDLTTKGINEECDNISKEIDYLNSLLLQEIEDEHYFLNSNKSIYQDVINLENNFLRIVSLMPDIEKTYKINDENKLFIENLKSKINDLGKSKRVLETLIHSSTKQPYSTLKEKLENLGKDYESASEEVEKFKVFIQDLKDVSEEAFSLLYAYYYRCKQIENIIRIMNVPNFTDRFKTKIEDCYSLLNEIDGILKIMPIDVDQLKEKITTLKDNMNPFFDEIENKFREEQLAESAIVYSNRDRNHQANVHQQISLLENEFFNGEFEKVYHDANEIYKRNHVEDSN